MTRHIHSLATLNVSETGQYGPPAMRLLAARCSLRDRLHGPPERAATEGCYGTPRRRHTVGISGMSRPIAGVIPSVFLAFATALALPASARADLGLWFTSPRAHW